jgi:hypothetical protein
MLNYLGGSGGIRSECGDFQVISCSSVHQVELFSQQESCKIPEHRLQYRKEHVKLFNLYEKKKYEVNNMTFSYQQYAW